MQERFDIPYAEQRPQKESYLCVDMNTLIVAILAVLVVLLLFRK